MLQRFAMVLLGASLLGGIAGAEEYGWRDADGKRLPDTEWRKSSQGFAAMLLNTSDADWWEKWNRPETPNYKEVKSVRKGGQVVTLIFIVNAATGPDGTLNVVCDIKAFRPDGSQSMGVEGRPCLWGKPSDDPTRLRLAPTAHTFIGEEGDPPGTWKVDITVHDAVRNVSIELHTSFEYLGDAPKK